MELIQSRNAATLLPIIQAHVQSNTTNHSDELAAYRRVHQLPNVCRHQVNHSLHFVDPRTGVHIESYWSRVKRKFKRMKRVHLHQMPVERAVWNYSIHGIDKHHPRHRRTVSCIRLALYHRYLTSAAYYINISWYPPFDLPSTYPIAPIYMCTTFFRSTAINVQHGETTALRVHFVRDCNIICSLIALRETSLSCDSLRPPGPLPRPHPLTCAYNYGGTIYPT